MAWPSRNQHLGQQTNEQSLWNQGSAYGQPRAPTLGESRSKRPCAKLGRRLPKY